MGETPTGLTRRDWALLRAIAAGRGELSGRCGPELRVDGGYCCDPFAVRRLIAGGLVEPPQGALPGPARLTTAGQALLPVAA